MDPTRKDAGVPDNLRTILDRTKQAVDRPPAPPVELHIAYDLQTGEIQMAGPRDPLLFYGILELARDTFNAQQAKARAESESRITLVPGALAEEARR